MSLSTINNIIYKYYQIISKTDNELSRIVFESCYFKNNLLFIDNDKFVSKFIILVLNNDKYKKNKWIQDLVLNSKFLLNPQIACMEIQLKYENIEFNLSCFPLLRLIPLCISKNYLNDVIDNCIITHFDSRVIGISIIYITILRLKILNKTIDIDKIISNVLDIIDKQYINEIKFYSTIKIIDYANLKSDNLKSDNVLIFLSLLTNIFKYNMLDNNLNKGLDNILDPIYKTLLNPIINNNYCDKPDILEKILEQLYN